MPTKAWRHMKTGVVIGVAIVGAMGVPACNAALGISNLYVNCRLGSKHCAGDTPEVCDENGEWQSEPPCEPKFGCDTDTGECAISPTTDGGKTDGGEADGVVSLVSGQVWQRAPSVKQYSWSDAKDYCASLSIPPYT